MPRLLGLRHEDKGKSPCLRSPGQQGAAPVSSVLEGGLGSRRPLHLQAALWFFRIILIQQVGVTAASQGGRNPTLGVTPAPVLMATEGPCAARTAGGGTGHNYPELKGTREDHHVVPHRAA